MFSHAIPLPFRHNIRMSVSGTRVSPWRFGTFFVGFCTGGGFEMDKLAHSPFLFALACFRIGADTRAIESGAWQRKERSERKCLICNSDRVEDEVHFIYDCLAYDDLRVVFHSQFADSGHSSLKAFLNLQSAYSVGKFLYLSNQIAVNRRLSRSRLRTTVNKINQSINGAPFVISCGRTHAYQTICVNESCRLGAARRALGNEHSVH